MAKKPNVQKPQRAQQAQKTQQKAKTQPQGVNKQQLMNSSVSGKGLQSNPDSVHYRTREEGMLMKQRYDSGEEGVDFVRQGSYVAFKPGHYPKLTKERLRGSNKPWNRVIITDDDDE